MTRDPYMGLCIMPGCDNQVSDIDPDLSFALNELNARFPHVCQCHTRAADGHNLILWQQEDGLVVRCTRPVCGYEKPITHV